MSQVEFCLIKYHTKTLDDVPANLYDEVSKLLADAGLDGNGNPINVEAE